MKQPSGTIGFCVLLIVGMSIGVTAATYSISIQDGVNTPDRTISLEGNSFTVDGIAEISTGDSITVSVTRPSGMPYRVYIYGTRDGSRQIIDSKYRSSGDTVTFDTSKYPDLYTPGTYTVALHADGDYRAVYPFVVSGATITVDAPETAKVGESVTIRTSITPTDDSVDLSGAEIVLYGDGDSKRVTVEGSSGEYSATIDTSGFSAGEYTVYVAANNDSRTPMNHKEVIAIDTRQTLALQTDSSSGTQGSGSGGTSGTGGTQPTTASKTTTTTTPVTGTATGTSTNSTPPSSTTETPTDMVTPTSATDTIQTPASTTNSNIITPNTDSPLTTPTTTPGFGLFPAMLGILTAGFVLYTKL